MSKIWEIVYYLMIITLMLFLEYYIIPKISKNNQKGQFYYRFKLAQLVIVIRILYLILN